jgi:hypothetical protein
MVPATQHHVFDTPYGPGGFVSTWKKQYLKQAFNVMFSAVDRTILSWAQHTATAGRHTVTNAITNIQAAWANIKESRTNGCLEEDVVRVQSQLWWI